MDDIYYCTFTYEQFSCFFFDFRKKQYHLKEYCPSHIESELLKKKKVSNMWFTLLKFTYNQSIKHYVCSSFLYSIWLVYWNIHYCRASISYHKNHWSLMIILNHLPLTCFLRLSLIVILLSFSLSEDFQWRLKYNEMVKYILVLEEKKKFKYST